MKRFFMRIIVGIVLLVILFTPYLLIIDFNQFAPVVFLIWVMSFTAYVMIQRKNKEEMKRKQMED